MTINPFLSGEFKKNHDLTDFQFVGEFDEIIEDEGKNMVYKEVVRNAFDFKANKILEGTLQGFSKSQFEGNDFLIKDLKGNEWLVFGKTALQSKMANIKIGAQIKIEYLGEKKGEKSGRLYEDFRVYVNE